MFCYFYLLIFQAKSLEQATTNFYPIFYPQKQLVLRNDQSGPAFYFDGSRAKPVRQPHKYNNQKRY